MHLRRQLILLAALTLVLPWAALQYVSEMQSILRDGQLRAMTASAKAVAKLVASDGEYLALISQNLAGPDHQPLYAHPLLAPPIVDGYDDEWRYFPFQPRALGSPDLPVHGNIQLAEYGTSLFAFARVHDRDLHYHNPAQDAVASGDHLVLRTRDARGQAQTYFVSASAPGKAQIYQRMSQQRIQQEHRIRAYWQERSGGYQIEVQVPKDLAELGLAVTLVSQSNMAPMVRLASHPETLPAPPVMHQLADVTALLAVFAEPDQRWMVFSPERWLLADTGEFVGQHEATTGETPSDPAYGWLWKLLLAKPNLASWRDPALNGQLEVTEQGVSEGFSGGQWFQSRGQFIARVHEPIYTGRQLAGFVVLEQNAQAHDAGTRQAMARLLFYSLLAVFVLGAGLFGYASWLSWRVQRLARAAERALGDGGVIEHQLPDNQSEDELGGLSRSFSHLLVRLREYTEYLQTLSSKLSHELRTPLAVVKSSLENMQSEVASQTIENGEQTAVYRARAQAGVDRLSGILNAMSSASRLEESLAHSEAEILPLDELIRDVANAYCDSFGRTIEAQVVAADYRVALVPDLIVQMLDKLVENAVDFCPPEGRIVISLVRRASILEIRVINDGPLLPDAMQHQLFDSLVSVRARDVGQNSHLGLGLHIVKLVAAFHGGQVSADNKFDPPGVCFTVQLPIR